MRKAILLLMLALSLCSAWPAQARTPYMDEEELKAAAQRGLGEILDLWHQGKYDELYDRTLVGGKQTKEGFIARLASAPCRPACCWEKMQDVRCTVKGDDTVAIRAKVGLEGGVETSFKTRDFKLVLEDDVWRISQSDILALAGAKKKTGRHTYRKRKIRYHSY